MNYFHVTPVLYFTVGCHLFRDSCNWQVLYSSFCSLNLSHRSHQSGGVKGILPEKP